MKITCNEAGVSTCDDEGRVSLASLAVMAVVVSWSGGYDCD